MAKKTMSKLWPNAVPHLPQPPQKHQQQPHILPSLSAASASSTSSSNDTQVDAGSVAASRPRRTPLSRSKVHSAAAAAEEPEITCKICQTLKRKYYGREYVFRTVSALQRHVSKYHQTFYSCNSCKSFHFSIAGCYLHRNCGCQKPRIDDNVLSSTSTPPNWNRPTFSKWQYVRLKMCDEPAAVREQKRMLLKTRRLPKGTTYEAKMASWFSKSCFSIQHKPAPEQEENTPKEAELQTSQCSDTVSYDSEAYSFSSIQAFVVHINKHLYEEYEKNLISQLHDEPDIICPVCKCSFVTLRTFAEHITGHGQSDSDTPINEFKCHICSLKQYHQPHRDVHCRPYKIVKLSSTSSSSSSLSASMNASSTSMNDRFLSSFSTFQRSSSSSSLTKSLSSSLSTAIKIVKLSSSQGGLSANTASTSFKALSSSMNYRSSSSSNSSLTSSLNGLSTSLKPSSTSLDYRSSSSSSTLSSLNASTSMSKQSSSSTFQRSLSSTSSSSSSSESKLYEPFQTSVNKPSTSRKKGLSSSTSSATTRRPPHACPFCIFSTRSRKQMVKHVAELHISDDWIPEMSGEGSQDEVMGNVNDFNAIQDIKPDPTELYISNDCMPDVCPDGFHKDAEDDINEVNNFQDVKPEFAAVFP